MSKIIDLAKKLKALADKGIGGEKINAEKMLNDLMQKHGISESDIEENTEHERFFLFTCEVEERLLYQITACVNKKLKCGTIPYELVKEDDLPGNFVVKSTLVEFIEIESRYEFYRQMIKDEFLIFIRAFYMSNDLLVKATDDDVEGIKKPDFKTHFKTMKMADLIESRKFLKQISDVQ